MPNYSNKSVIYARVSTIDKQEYDSQIEALQRLAEYEKLEVVAIFAEKISGTVKASERPEFNEMTRYIEENNIHHILVTELSRLGRKMNDTINIIQDFNDKEICVHISKDNLRTLNEDFTENRITGFIINVLIGFADFERDYIKDRSIRGIRFNVKNGGSGTGKIKPFGYKKVGKKLVIDEDEAEIVKLIFTKYLNGYTSQKIADFLNEKQIKTRYNTIFSDDQLIKTRKGRYKKASEFIWRSATIINILNNTIYFGARVHKGEIFEIEPIVDEDTFNKVKAIRESNYNKRNNSTKYQNIFKDRILCPVCGSGYYLHKRHDNKDNAYKCLSKRLKDITCDNVSVNIDKLNNAIYLVLKTAFKFQSSIDKKLSSKTVTISEEITLLNSVKNQLLEELNKFKSRQKELVISHIDKSITKELFNEINTELISSIEDLQEKINKKNKNIIDAQNLLSTLSTKQNRNLENVEIFKNYVRDYISYIKIYNVTELVNAGNLGKHFTVKNDIISLVEVKSELIDSYHTFLISRYSKILIQLDLNDCENLENKIPYITDFDKLVVGIDIAI